MDNDIISDYIDLDVELRETSHHMIRYNVDDYRPSPDSLANYLKVCERRCPQCNYRMVTNHKGKFYCNRCNFKDFQNIESISFLKDIEVFYDIGKVNIFISQNGRSNNDLY